MASVYATCSFLKSVSLPKNLGDNIGAAAPTFKQGQNCKRMKSNQNVTVWFRCRPAVTIS